MVQVHKGQVRQKFAQLAPLSETKAGAAERDTFISASQKAVVILGRNSTEEAAAAAGRGAAGQQGG